MEYKMWDVSKEMKRMLYLDELKYLSKRPAFYNFLDEYQKALIDYTMLLAKERLEDMEIRKYSDMWE